MIGPLGRLSFVVEAKRAGGGEKRKKGALGGPSFIPRYSKHGRTRARERVGATPLLLTKKKTRLGEIPSFVRPKSNRKPGGGADINQHVDVINNDDQARCVRRQDAGRGWVSGDDHERRALLLSFFRARLSFGWPGYDGWGTLTNILTPPLFFRFSDFASLRFHTSLTPLDQQFVQPVRGRQPHLQ